MRKFLARHPYIKRLLQKVVTLVVVWNVVLVLLFGGVIALVIVSLLGGDMSSGSGDYKYIFGNGTQRLLSVRVDGTIVGTQPDDTGILDNSDQTSGYDVKKKLFTAANDSTIHGVILEVDSPGGTIYGARAIAEGVAYYKQKTHNPVYTYVEGLAASGGYWAAASTDKIIADYGSSVGSIGIIMGPFEYYDTVLAQDGGLLNGGVVTQNGIQDTYITAGRSKDIGNPYRKLTADEISVMQQSVNNEYDNFVQYVSEHRDIPATTIRSQLGALTYDNKTAQQYKLIDDTASREGAYDRLAAAAGIHDDYAVVREESASSILHDALSAITRQPQTQAKEVDTCSLTKSALAYHGDVAALCNK